MRDSVWVTLGLVVLIVLSVPTLRELRGWRAGRRAAWERERVLWRAWISRP
ncbi:MAG TPA: hypothetical protein VFD73_03280 [Gemmatimonadales bacterium]|nr:hypothetical protein [Gemmatimonadales bacterium]